MEADNGYKSNAAVRQRPVKEPGRQKSDYLVKVIATQSLVCAFVLLLVFVTGKISPGAFENFKNEYGSIMSVNISVSEVLSSAKEVATFVFAPSSAIKNKAQEEESTTKTESSKDDKSETTTKANEADTQEESAAEDLSSDTSSQKKKIVAALASMGADESITAPVHGKVSSVFGNRTNPVSGEYTLHAGIDIAVDEGTKVAAAYSGVVTKVGSDDKSGKYIKMTHMDGMQTVYCHCSKILVKEDDVIRAGEIIALSGDTGWSTGPHLHFGIIVDGERVDPLDYLSEKDGYV